MTNSTDKFRVVTVRIRMPKSNAQRGEELREEKKEEKLAASPGKNVTKKQKKNSSNSPSATAKSPSEYT
ncbi:hypothetical protein TNCV_1381331 [Trichonephila clavipes]|nr:hypothetical protein TNCV_1381331 [Trichonephila clavipes]